MNVPNHSKAEYVSVHLELELIVHFYMHILVPDYAVKTMQSDCLRRLGLTTLIILPRVYRAIRRWSRTDIRPSNHRVYSANGVEKIIIKLLYTH